jgi:hypothetical protein
MKSRSELILEAIVPLSRQPGDFTAEITEYGQPCVEFDGHHKPEMITVPAIPEHKGQLEDLARVIRMHELLHARNTDQKWWPSSGVSPAVCNAYEDGRVHGVYWPREVGEGGSLNDALLRQTELDWQSLMKPGLRDDQSATITVALRCLASMKTLGLNPADFPATDHVVERLGQDGYQEIEQLVERIASDESPAERNQTLKRLQRLMQVEDGGKGAGEGKGEGDAKVPMPKEKWLWGGIGGPIADGWIKGKGVEMVVYDPPKNTPCTRVAPNRKLMRKPYGNRLNFAKLPSFVIDYDSTKLFIARKDMGVDFKGTIVIDGSGSMGAKPERLQALCRAIPSATVAFYSGAVENEERRKHPFCAGSLVIYAHKGMRVADGARLPHNGANEVDAAAIEWLLEQKGPHFLVTDQDFGGGWDGQAARARKLLQGNPQVKIIDSIHDAWLQLCGQHEPNASE